MVSKYIKDKFLRRVFSFHPLLIGGNPFDTPSIYTLIVQFEKQWGVHYALGGTGAIVRALGKLFEASWAVQSIWNAEVSEIVIENRKAVGIRMGDGTFIPADYRRLERRCGFDLSLPHQGRTPPRVPKLAHRRDAVQHVIVRDLFRHQAPLFGQQTAPSQHHPQ
jgi:hypothetical protein